MAVRIALLRAVNVAGRNLVAMSALREMLDDLGLENGRTLLQSGNLLFESAASPARLEVTLERELHKRFGLRTGVMVRTLPELRAAVAANPFFAEARRDPGHLLLLLLKEVPAKGALPALRASIARRERVEVAGRHAYLVYPDGVGRSKLTSALIERHLGVTGTARNWNTVLKLVADAPA